MIALSAHAEGWLLPVRAQPGARKNAVTGVHAGSLKACVTAPADQGRANQALVELLRDILHLKRSQIELFSGPTCRDKRFLIRGLERAELENRLAQLLS